MVMGTQFPVGVVHRLVRAAAAVAVLVGVGMGGAAAQERFMSIGTGSTAGTYFGVGTAIAAAISNPAGGLDCDAGGSCGVPGLVAVARESDGSVANVRALQERRVALALAQADVSYWAFTGQGPFAGQAPLDGLRAIGRLYPEPVHVVVRRGAGVAGLADLAGRAISLDQPQSGTRLVAEAILALAGLTPAEVDAQFIDPGDAVEEMLDGRLDAFVFVAGEPTPSVTYLAEQDAAGLLPLFSSQIDRLREDLPFFEAYGMPANAYPGIGATLTVSVGALLLVGTHVDTETVHGITAALWHPTSRAVLERAGPVAQKISAERAIHGVPIPFHPGALRFYRDAGLIEPNAVPAVAQPGRG